MRHAGFSGRCEYRSAHFDRSHRACGWDDPGAESHDSIAAAAGVRRAVSTSLVSWRALHGDWRDFDGPVLPLGFTREGIALSHALAQAIARDDRELLAHAWCA